ncbi:1,6-anhydro-N-acetylmuramyl-L-alanine amidase AmpD [Catenovulum sediminis]|uniref:1,6-anhydro-N-acetylmuramyl-L-alanine amidase AmpD n=1 Tax=Catenovulum sediminis TaxID=1740262 RepID=A0ABV1RKJ0_9ALTE|nr:1,6-anhydro-N-acetylmuramyl-L-alanine amidase AmpD [Catenovulum sediminis]
MKTPAYSKINNHHILPDAVFKASPHFNDRPNVNNINLLVIHCISLPAEQFGLKYIDDLFLGCLDCDADASFNALSGLRVSAHVLIRRTGEVVQFVPFDKRAWHAGVSCFKGLDNCNDFSIGIELEGADNIEYEAIQYQQLAKVVRQIQCQYPLILNDNIVGHCDIAPGRKTDPGPAFNWDYFFNLLDKEKQ